MRVLIGSEQPLFLDGLEALLTRETDIEVVSRCPADTSIVDRGIEFQPDVVLLDVDISRESSLEIVRRLNNQTPHAKVVLFTARAEGDALIEAVRLGVRGVLLKSGASSIIFDCLRQVHGGSYWLEKQMTAAALGKIVRREATQRQLSRAGLTPRELEIARLAGQGLRNVGIGTKLGISPATVKIHLHQIYRKLGLSGRLALMVYARDNDLV
jgi:DNA-binding NarL/FixJ family response regulator